MDVGGRAGNQPFHGASIAIAAGIGRKAKDHLLWEWLQELNQPTHEFTVKTQYAKSVTYSCPLKKQFALLRKTYRDDPPKKTTPFRQFAQRVLGKSAYQEFLVCAGFTDYEEEDTHDVLFYYGFEDNYTEWTGFSVQWSALIKTVMETVFAKRTNTVLKTGAEVIRLNRATAMDPDLFEITVKNPTSRELSVFQAKHIIMATTIESVLHLLPGLVSKSGMDLYRQIHGQPFLRIYGQVSKKSRPIMAKYAAIQTIVAGPIHKIIPIHPETGVYMIVYSDNDGAVFLKPYTENTPRNREVLSQLLCRAFQIEDPVQEPVEVVDIRSFYWPIGTHYYGPLRGPFANRREFIKAAQHPVSNVMIVGEMIALNQGWVGGALESVEAIMPYIV
jgi:hypothetical protein